MSPQALTFLDWCMVCGYFFLIVFMGLRFGRRQVSSERYFLASGQLPGWAVGLSMFATIISSWAFLALPGKSWSTDVSYLMVVSLVPVATCLAVLWVVPLFRHRIRLSAFEFLEQRFGAGARVYGNLAFLVVHFGKMAAILYLLCLAVAQMTGWNIHVLIAAVGLSTLVYTYFGGIEGVVWTDVVQGMLLFAAGVIAVAFLLFAAPVGPGEVLGTAWNAGKFRLMSFELGWEKASTPVLMIFGLNFYLQKFLADQTVVQRFLLAPSSGQASRALWISSGCLLLVWILFLTVGALLWSYYQLQPKALPAELLAKPDGIFPYYIAHEIPPGITGLMLAGLLAATMSTLSSDLNCLSAVFLDDYYRKLTLEKDDRTELRVSRFVVVAAGLLGIGLAMAMTRIHSMADAAFEFVSLVGGGVLGMYLLGILTRRASARGVYIGVVTAVALILWAYFCGPGKTGISWLPRFPLHGLWVGLMGNVVVFAVGYAASLLLPNSLRPNERSSLISFHE